MQTKPQLEHTLLLVPQVHYLDFNFYLLVNKILKSLLFNNNIFGIPSGITMPLKKSSQDGTKRGMHTPGRLFLHVFMTPLLAMMTQLVLRAN